MTFPPFKSARNDLRGSAGFSGRTQSRMRLTRIRLSGSRHPIVPPSSNAVPCIETGVGKEEGKGKGKKGKGGVDAVSCDVEPPDKCRGISCEEFDFCLDAADTNGDFRIDSEDSGVCVVEDGPLVVAIDSPASRLVTSDESIVVSGEVSRSAVSVAVNGVEASINGSAFASAFRMTPA